MARYKMMTSALVLSLTAGSALAQVSADTVRVDQPVQTIDKNIVRAQFIRPGDVSPEEYSRLLAEADRIRAYQNGSASVTAPMTYNAASQARTELAPQPYSQYKAQQAQTTQQTYTAQTQNVQGQTYYNTATQPAYQAQQPTYATSLVPNTAPAQTYTNTQTHAAPTYAAGKTTATYTTPVAAHNVVKGDTLYGISRRYGVQLSQLKGANRLNSNVISVGQTLTIPSVSKTVAVSTQQQVTAPVQTTRTTQTYAPTQSYGTTYVRNVQTPRSGVYAVLPKDTLYSIAKFACVSPAEVAQINGLNNASTLQPGQKLAMPAGHCLN